MDAKSDSVQKFNFSIPTLGGGPKQKFADSNLTVDFLVFQKENLFLYFNGSNNFLFCSKALFEELFPAGKPFLDQMCFVFFKALVFEIRNFT